MKFRGRMGREYCCGDGRVLLKEHASLRAEFCQLRSHKEKPCAHHADIRQVVQSRALHNLSVHDDKHLEQSLLDNRHLLPEIVAHFLLIFVHFLNDPVVWRLTTAEVESVLFAEHGGHGSLQMSVGADQTPNTAYSSIRDQSKDASSLN